MKLDDKIALIIRKCKYNNFPTELAISEIKELFSPTTNLLPKSPKLGVTNDSSQ